MIKELRKSILAWEGGLKVAIGLKDPASGGNY